MIVLMPLGSWSYVAQIVSSVIGILGFGALVFYAIDTRKLRLAAQEQVEAAIIPCVLITADPQKLGTEGAIKIENIGAGPALNVRWAFWKNLSWNSLPAIEAKKSRSAPFLLKDILNNDKVVVCEFESLSGSKYRTFSTIPEDTEHFDLRHRFYRATDDNLIEDL
jgi:hypothetical protein